MNNMQRENKQVKVNGAENEPAEKTSSGDTKTPCGCCGKTEKQ